MPEVRVADKRLVMIQQTETQVKKRIDKALVSVRASMVVNTGYCEFINLLTQIGSRYKLRDVCNLPPRMAGVNFV